MRRSEQATVPVPWFLPFKISRPVLRRGSIEQFGDCRSEGLRVYSVVPFRNELQEGQDRC
jgi:hypothetical protein